MGISFQKDYPFMIKGNDTNCKDYPQQANKEMAGKC
jgi:hypothetical protein